MCWPVSNLAVLCIIARLWDAEVSSFADTMCAVWSPLGVEFTIFAFQGDGIPDHG